jgi:hypothetical protein
VAANSERADLKGVLKPNSRHPLWEAKNKILAETPNEKGKRSSSFFIWHQKRKEWRKQRNEEVYGKDNTRRNNAIRQPVHYGLLQV